VERSTFRGADRDGSATRRLLMSTGLTFGAISALFGLTNHIIAQRSSRRDHRAGRRDG